MTRKRTAGRKCFGRYGLNMHRVARGFGKRRGDFRIGEWNGLSIEHDFSALEHLLNGEGAEIVDHGEIGEVAGAIAPLLFKRKYRAAECVPTFAAAIGSAPIAMEERMMSSI